MNTGAALFNPASVKLTRKRFSTTQGEVLVEYAGVRIEQYSDKIELGANGWAGLDDTHWIDVARREAIFRGLASEPAAVDLPTLNVDQVRTILAALEAVSPSGGGSAPYTLFRQLQDATGLAPSIVDVLRFQRNAHAEVTGENC